MTLRENIESRLTELDHNSSNIGLPSHTETQFYRALLANKMSELRWVLSLLDAEESAKNNPPSPPRPNAKWRYEWSNGWWKIVAPWGHQQGSVYDMDHAKHLVDWLNGDLTPKAEGAERLPADKPSETNLSVTFGVFLVGARVSEGGGIIYPDADGIARISEHATHSECLSEVENQLQGDTTNDYDSVLTILPIYRRKP